MNINSNTNTVIVIKNNLPFFIIIMVRIVGYIVIIIHYSDCYNSIRFLL